MPRERERQLEVGQRLRELRGPRPQPVIADAVGVTLRAYQRWEKGGGIAWENLQALGEYFGVSENYLLYGVEQPEGPKSQLDRIEAGVQMSVELLNELLASQAPCTSPRTDQNN